MNFFDYLETSNGIGEFIFGVVIMVVPIVITTVCFFLKMERAKKHKQRLVSVTHEVNNKIEEQSVLNSRQVFLVMNTYYYDAILAGLTSSLSSAGYKLSEIANVDTLLPDPVFEKIAQEVDKTRQEYMTSLHYNTSDVVLSNMKDGYAQRFLAELIRGCSQLGWKVVPTGWTPEGECVNSYSTSS